MSEPDPAAILRGLILHRAAQGVFLLRYRLSAFLLAVLLAAVPAAAQDFDSYFTEGGLRVDVVHSGTADAEAIAVRRIVREPYWAGPKNHLIPKRDRGKYAFQLVDKASGTQIFRYGFSTLFGEWTTTPEAQKVRRAFEETLEMPFPKAPVTLTFFSRATDGALQPIFTTDIDPSNHQIGRAPLLPADDEAEVIELQVTGDPAERVDLIVLGDGYQADEKEKFRGDLDRFMENFFGAEPFKSHWEDFNVRAVFFPSNDSGVDEPRKGIYNDTPFGMMFNMFDLPRYCMTEDVWQIHDCAAQAPHDAVLLMANSSRYGGGAIYNHYTVFVSDNEYDDYLVVHEFGHGFAGLGDEYYTSAVAYNEFYPRGVEPWEPNITSLLDPANLKWRRYVDPGTPLPTPENDSRYAGKVGAFEGAGYAAKGLFRPAKDCKMFSKGNRNFCPVCAAAVVETIDHYVGR